MALLIGRKGLNRAAGGVAADLAAAQARVDQAMTASVGETMSVSAYRMWFDEYAERIAPMAVRPKLQVQDTVVDGAAGLVPVRIYRPERSLSTIALVHGGGWVMGSIETHDHIARWLSSATDSDVVSTDYALSPEHPYPFAVQQVASVLRRLLADRRLKGELPLFVAGDSAGANIASLAILELDEAERAQIAGFISIYGAYSPQMNLSSHKLFASGDYGLSKQQMQFFWNLYAPHIEPSERARITPLGRSMAHFPPTLCVGAEYDILLDDTLSFYSALASVGADVTLSLWPGVTHGSLHFVERVESVTTSAQSIVQYIVSRRASTSDDVIPGLGRLISETAGASPILLPMLEEGAKLVLDKTPLIETPHLMSRSRQHGSVTHRLGGEIVGGVHGQGALVPTEDEIGPEVNISRNAYREAIRTLAAKGLVAATPKVGTRVTSRGAWRLLDPDVLAWHFETALTGRFLRSLFELRKVVEPSAAALAAVRMTPQMRAQLTAVLSEMTRIEIFTPDWNAALLRFHRLLLEGGGNELLAALWPSFEVVLQWLANLGTLQAGNHLRDPVADYALVIDRLMARDAGGAMTQMAYLIDASLADAEEMLRLTATDQASSGD